MRRALKIIAGLLLVLIIVVIGGVFVLTRTDWGREQVRIRAVAALNDAAHGIVKVGRISGDLLTSLTLHDFSITDSSGAPFIAASEVHSAYGIRALIGRKIQLSDVRLVNPVIVLDRPPNGTWNYERIFPSDTVKTARDTTKVGFGDWIVLEDLRLVNGTLTVRTPWTPDTTLTGKSRDAAIDAALRGKTRVHVQRAPGGYQQVQEFTAIHAHLPLLRLAHPDYSTRRFEIDSLRTVALLFTPPAADVRQLSGIFELDSDSLWFRKLEMQLPASHLASEGSYQLQSGNIAVRAKAAPAALADLRFAYPALPEEGSATFDASAVLAGSKQQVFVNNLALQTGRATASGKLGFTLGDTILIHETDLTFAGIHTRLIEQLVPGLDVPRSGVLSGHAVVDGSLSSMRADGDVTFDDERSGRNRVIAVGEIGAANGVFRARNLRVHLSPVQVDLARLAMRDLPIGGTVTGSATINGSTATRIVATGVDLTHLDRGERSRITGQGAVQLGKVMIIDADLQTRPLSLVTVGRFAPAAKLRGSVEGPLSVHGTLQDLLVSSTLHSSDGGVISARGRLDLASKDIGYSMDVATVLFNAHALVETAPLTSLSAQMSARGRGFDPATMNAELSADVTTSTIDTIALDSSRIRARIANGVASFDTLAVRAPGAAVDVLGTFGITKTTTGNLTYKVSVDSLQKLARYFPNDSGVIAPRPLLTAEQLAKIRADSAREAQRLMVARAAGAAPPAKPVVIDTPPPIKRDSLAGSLLAEGRLNGGLGGFDLRGNARSTGLIAAGNVVQHARANYEWIGALTPSAMMRVDLNADSISAAGFYLDSLATKLTYQKPGGSAQVAVFQSSRRDYSIKANYAIYPDRRELMFQDLRMRFDTTTWASTAPGRILWGQPGIEIENFDVRNGRNGRIYADGKVPSEGAADLSVDIQNFQLGDLLGLLQSDVDARALLSLKGRVTGTSAAPIMSGTASVLDSRYNGKIVPDLRTTFDYANVRLAAKADATYQGKHLLDLNGNVPVNLAVQGVTGPRLPDEPVTVDFRADSIPLDLVSNFTDVVTNTSGYVVGAGSMRGTIKKPRFAGDLSLANAQARVTQLGVLLTAINGAVHLRGDSIVIDSIAARSGGRIAITGGLGVANFATPSFNLHLTVDNAKILDNDQGRVKADADITAVGPFNSVAVNGRARVREGVFYIPQSDNKQVLNAGDAAVFAVVDTTRVQDDQLLPGQSPLLANMRMNLTLAIDRDTWVRSQEANVEVYSDGDLRINIDRRREILTLDGVVNTDRGEYTFMSKRFQIKRGAVTFIGTNEIDPIVSVTAEYAVKQATRAAINIRILIGGTVRRPRITLESDAQPPISQSDLLSYLAFGSESGSLLQFGGGTSVSGGSTSGGLVGTSAALATRQLAGVALGIGVKEIEGEAARSLGADVFNITTADIPTELGSNNFGALTGFLKGTQLEFGKYFNTQTFVGLNLQATAIPGFRVEHRLRNHPGLSIESTFQPRYFLPDPSLAEQDLKKANAFGLFLVRRWRF